jgi:peptidoglycan/xylan/chitin deacetylase (PgdA/CDA1 family)
MDAVVSFPSLEERLASAIPTPVYRMLIRRPVLHFFYHTISARPLAHIRYLYPCKTPEVFEEDLVYLKNHFQPVSYQQLLEYVEAKKPLPARAAMLSFDDGLAESYTSARPLLIKHGLPCIFFITTGVIDNQDMLYRHKISLCIEKASRLDFEQRQAAFAYLSHSFALTLTGLESFAIWVKGLKDGDQEALQAACQALEVDIPGYLREHCPYLTGEQARNLKADGFTLGAHGIHHVKFNLLDEAGMEEELVRSCQSVQEISGEKRVPFAFPFSASGVEREAIRRVLDRNPQLGLVFDTKGVRKDAAFIFNRIWSDVPAPGNRQGSDIPWRMHRAYEDVFLSKMRRLKMYTGKR